MSNKPKLSVSFYNQLRGTDAYTRHKRLIESYVQFYGGKKPTNIPANYKTERDVIRENHKFVHSDLDKDATWEQRVAKKYYDKLFKEYAICELKYYREGKIALRWRAEKEVMTGKGQFICASTRCESITSLHSWEVNFGYVEDGEKKNELVKVRLCLECSDKLNYKTKKKLAKSLKRKRKERESSKSHKKSRKEENNSGSSGEEGSTLSENDSDEEQEKEKAEPSIWSKPLEKADEKTKEEEYEDYFADLLQ